RYRDTGTVLPKKAEETGKQEKVLERIEDLSREIKALVNSQSREIEDIARRLEKLEKLPYSKIDENQSRRFQKIPREQMRVGVFVDVQNMFYAAKKLDGARLNYEVMLDTILAGRRLIKAVAYIVEARIDQSGFISVLEKKGYQVRRKGLKSFGDGTAKGDWDMGMAIDMIEIAGQLDVVVLVSGDGDFVSLVSLIKKTGPRVELYAFGHNLSTELREVSDQFYEISSDLLLKNHHQQNITSTIESNNNNVEKLPGEFGEVPPEKNKGKR
ncbi:NYN domain-containing protein, partial [Gemmatimonadota bacterium]